MFGYFVPFPFFLSRCVFFVLETDAALSRLTGAEHHTRLLFEEQRNQILSDTRSEIDMQELRSENADMALRESNRQIHSHRMEPYHTNQVYENSRRAQAWLQAELENRERAQQETCFRTLQEVEELKMNGSTQAESTLESRADDLSRQDLRESQSTVNQLTVQIQEFQDKVDSLNDPRDFRDLETASSSGLSDVHRHPPSVPSSFEKPCRDPCPQPDTRNSLGTGETFLKLRLHQMNRQHLVQEICMQEVVQLRMVAHVEKKSFFEMIKDPNRKDLFEATPKLVQSWKSTLRIT